MIVCNPGIASHTPGLQDEIPQPSTQGICEAQFPTAAIRPRSRVNAKICSDSTHSQVSGRRHKCLPAPEKSFSSSARRSAICSARASRF